MIHIGKKINEVIKTKGVTIASVRTTLGISRQNMDNIFHRESIDTELLLSISLHLKHDFFSYYSETIQQSSSLSATQVEEIRKYLKMIENIITKTE